MTTQRVQVFCDDAFHEGQDVEVRAFTRQDGEWMIAAPSDDLMAGDVPFFDAGHRISDAEGIETRERRRIECTCGANLIRRAELLEPFLEKLADGGVSRISLRRLNLLVSRQA